MSLKEANNIWIMAKKKSLYLGQLRNTMNFLTQNTLAQPPKKSTGLVPLLENKFFNILENWHK